MKSSKRQPIGAASRSPQVGVHQGHATASEVAIRAVNAGRADMLVPGAIVHLQEVAGNKSVTDFVTGQGRAGVRVSQLPRAKSMRDGRAVQRQEGPASGLQAPPIEYKAKVPVYEGEPIDLGYLKLKKVEYEAAIKLKPEGAPSGSVTVAPGEAGVKASATKLIGDQMGVTVPKGVKILDLEATGVGGKVSTGYAFEGQNFGVDLGFNLVNVETEKSTGKLKVEFGTLTAGILVKTAEHEVDMGDNGKWNWEAEGKFEFVFEPNWEKIIPELEKQAGKEIAKEASEEAAEQTMATEAEAAAAEAGAEGGTEVAMVGLGAAAELLVIPATIAVLAYGFYETAKSCEAAKEGVAAGVEARQRAKNYADAYAAVMTGSKPRGGPGAAEGVVDAENQITAQMAKGATRADVIAATTAKFGGYQAIHDQALARVRDILYDEAVNKFEEGHTWHWYDVERIGPDWGERGIFRKDLYLVLYSPE